jgi:hypothetical protein
LHEHHRLLNRVFINHRRSCFMYSGRTAAANHKD